MRTRKGEAMPGDVGSTLVGLMGLGGEREEMTSHIYCLDKLLDLYCTRVSAYTTSGWIV